MASEVTFQGERDFWRYDPERRLGSPGGFGSVFEGRGSATASVAVKVIPPSPDVPKRLLFREREIAKKLGDVPGDRLIRVRDTAEVDGTLFIVMEQAKESLAQFLKRHRALAEDKTILVLRDVAAGLRQLQEASVIHRDLKPENILFDEGHWKLGDFGIARDADLGTQSLTFLGWGSYPYMAPETWRGLSPSIKTDLYALGCVAFELLTGSPPFPGPEPDFARQHKVEPPPASALEGSRLKPLVLRLLSKDPASRPQDAKAVENSLAAAAAQVGQPYGRIASLAGEHAGERAHEDAMLSARQAQEAARKGLVTQAAADLEDTLREAIDQIRREEPEANYEWNGSVATISGPNATIEFRIQPDFRSPVDVDSVAGLV